MPPPTSTESENVTRPYQDELLNAPQVIRKMAIVSAVHQILKYFEETRSGRIGISGSGWVEVAKALEDQPRIRNMFDVVQCVSLSQQQSIIELQMNIAEQSDRPPNIINTLPYDHRTRALLLVDYIDEQIDLHDLNFADGSCVTLNTRSHNFNDIVALDLEIRMEDHLLPWKLFCKNVGRVLDHSSTLQRKAARLIGECQNHLLAINLLAGALKDVTDVDVWELALRELMSLPSSKVQGMSVVMVNVLRFIWGRMNTPTKKLH